MFRIYKAVFDTAGGSAVFENTDVQRHIIRIILLYGRQWDATVTVLVT